MVVQTFTGSALTRTAFPGAPELYRDLAAGVNPVFYVSSSPWNLHAFLLAFLRHRDFPLGPVLLRDLLGNRHGREQKHTRIREVLDLHPDLSFVLLGDSGEHDPQIYADIVREYPGRILAVYIREVRLNPGDGRVEKVSDAWDSDVPFVLVRRLRRRTTPRAGPRPALTSAPQSATRNDPIRRIGRMSADRRERHPARMTVGFIGLGTMGLPMALNMARAGTPLVGVEPFASGSRPHGRGRRHGRLVTRGRLPRRADGVRDADER